MCWIAYTDEDHAPKLKKADKDIPIFKVCLLRNNASVQSYFKYFDYQLGVEYTQPNNLIIEDGQYCYKLYKTFQVHEGFHSYANECYVDCNEGTINVHLLDRELGVDTYKSLFHKTIVVEGHIPKGSNYLLNRAGHYVSDRIVLTKMTDICVG